MERLTLRSALRLALAAVTAAAMLAAAPARAAWQPEPATYGFGQTSYTVRMSDGVRLHVAVYFPTDPKTGQAAPGPFPVLFTQTPYGTIVDTLGGLGGPSTAALTGKNPYMVQRGYIEADMDVRGTGGSEGTFDLLNPIEAHDGAAVARWAAGLPHSSGVVGLVGASYLGITQFGAAADAGPGSPIKAMFPIIAATDVYRDTAFAGGVPDIEFGLPYLGAGLPGLALLNPPVTGGPTLLGALTQHLQGIVNSQVPQILNVVQGGADSFDGPYWDARSPFPYLKQIVADKIPAFLIGGWYDLFQRGEPLNYSGLQNAYRGRPVFAPMLAHQPVTGRYQLLDGPFYHVTAGNVSYRGLDLDGLELAWFDRWLKRIHTGIDVTSSPLHVYDLGTNEYREAARYPFAQAKPTTYYFQAGHALSTSKPPASSGADQIAFSGASIPCTTSSEQWGAGFGQFFLSYLNAQDYCAHDSTLSQTGPGTVNYTTEPFTKPTTIAGPIGATIYATANTKETVWVVSISDVSPQGQAHQLTEGVLAGSLRALDNANTWMGSNGRPILPYHPYTQSSYAPVVPGKLTRYDIEIFPTFVTLLPGHRLRVTVATGDFPHIFPDGRQLPNLLGGIYQVQRTAAAASSVELPLSTPSAFTQPLAPVYCAKPTGRLSGTSLGPVRLGQTRAKARSEFPKFATRSRRDMDFYCLSTGSGIRAGFPLPKLLRTLSARERSRVRGRVILLLTTNRHYALRGVRPGTRLAAVTSRLHVGKGYKVGLNTWYITPGKAANGVLEVRHGTIQEIGIANQRLTSSRAAALRFFTSFR
jgi:putative CocE/NonD family hydrolase